MARVVRAPEVRVKLERLGYEVEGGSSGEFATYMRAEMEKYAKVVKASGAKVD